MASDAKTEEIKEYYLNKLKEAVENALNAPALEERKKWKKIALGYEMLAGVPGSTSEMEQDSTVTRFGAGT